MPGSFLDSQDPPQVDKRCYQKIPDEEMLVSDKRTKPGL